MNLAAFPTPDPRQCPFVPPSGATQNGGPVGTQNYTLYVSKAAACALAAQYQQAAANQGYAINLTLQDGTLPGGSYLQFEDAPANPQTNFLGGRILVVVATLTDAAGNEYQISDVAGERVFYNVYPFTPGQVTQGDKNYKVVQPVVDGIPQPSQAEDIALPAWLQLIDQSSGQPLVGGQSFGSQARGIWRPMPVPPPAPITPVAPNIPSNVI
jgi:hypothetical protein